jgi:hypothetical protein
MSIKNNQSNPSSTIRINKSLDKFTGQVLFPDKVSKAKQMLKGIELPKKKKKS